MKINILLPYKEKFDKNRASSVSLTVRNNLFHTRFINQIKIYGQNTDVPLFKENFIGFKYSIFSLKSKNSFLAHKMMNMISKYSEKNQIIELHNRPNLVEQIFKNTNLPISLFFHNDPQTMRGTKSIKERERVLEQCIAVFCVSEFIKNKFLIGIANNRDKVHVLHNGVERKLTSLPIKKKEVLFVGRIVREKGVDLYVNAVTSIASYFPDWSFDIIGSYRLGEDDNTNSFAKKIQNKFNKIGTQVNFHGFKSQKFVQEKMKTTSIIVIPSIWEEPFGMVAAEAMSNGIAIIASNVGGIPEIVGESGVLINDINSQKIEKALIELIKNPNKRKKLQKKSWENFRHSANYSSKKLDYYREIILSGQVINY